MTRNISLDWAKRWSVAHEDWPGNPNLERVMDTYNNNDGQKIAGYNPSLGDDQLKDMTLKWVDRGLLRRLSGDKSHLVPTDSTGRKWRSF
jgi:hypothetical protein